MTPAECGKRLTARQSASRPDRLRAAGAYEPPEDVLAWLERLAAFHDANPAPARESGTADQFAERRARADMDAFDRITDRTGGEPPRPDDVL